ncbi:MAG: class II fructose-bisphosphate aldolase, partial [Promicromonosporaceae bacterium]|nr:class II fructose-bisphosphate aldolase [Promicromonosporaceae bacterium]
MPLATPEIYQEMLKRAKAGKFAYPAVNITSSSTITAAMQGFADAKSDGIIQVSVGGAEYASGSTIKDRVAGSLALAAYAKEVAKGYPVNIALHTDHCVEKNLASWVIPLLELEAEQVKRGENPTFVSHMFDGSDIPLEHNLEVAAKLLKMSEAAHTVLEIEVGVVGGEEDGHVAEINEKLYTTAEDGFKT